MEKDVELARLQAELAALAAAREQAEGTCHEADALLQQGYHREAIPKYNQAIAEAEKIAYSDIVSMAQKQLARCYYHLGHMEVAQRYMERASKILPLTRSEEVFLETINRKLWDKEGKERRAEGF